MPTHEQFLAKLDALGVGAVKERIAANQYPSEFRNVAQGWVERKEAGSNGEQLSLARQAKWIASAPVGRGRWHLCATLTSSFGHEWRSATSNTQHTFTPR